MHWTIKPDMEFLICFIILYHIVIVMQQGSVALSKKIISFFFLHLLDLDITTITRLGPTHADPYPSSLKRHKQPNPFKQSTQGQLQTFVENSTIPKFFWIFQISKSANFTSIRNLINRLIRNDNPFSDHIRLGAKSILFQPQKLKIKPNNINLKHNPNQTQTYLKKIRTRLRRRLMKAKSSTVNRHLPSDTAKQIRRRWRWRQPYYTRDEERGRGINNLLSCRIRLA